MTNPYGPRAKPRRVADTFREVDSRPAEEKASTSFWIPAQLRQALRVCAVENGTTFSALLVEGGQHVLRKYRGADGQAAPAAPAEKTVNTSFWIPVELRQELRVCAAENGTTFSALLVEGGRHVLRKYSSQK